MIFCARTLGSAIVSPQRALFAFFVIPLVLLLTDRSPANQLMVLDAIFGVGIIAWVFLITLRANQVLSERELDVLRDLPSRLTVDEIAEAEAVSKNTVKTHIRAIYQKLGVSSRSEAVRKARDRGLL